MLALPHIENFWLMKNAPRVGFRQADSDREIQTRPLAS